MANVNHSSLTDPYLHEPKGVATATSGDVYVANGSGSGAWTAKQTLIELSIEGYLEDVSSVEKVYVPIPFAGTVSKVLTVLEASISSSNSIVTVKNSAGSSMGTLTITASGSAAGDIDTLAPTSNNTVTADSFITIESNGGSTNTAKLRFVVVLDRS
jgi:hypothetical protein